MPAKTHFKVIRNDTSKVIARLNGNLQKRVPEVARVMRDDLAEALTSGSLPIQPDTSSLANGLAVQTAKGSDFSEKRQQSKSAYLGNPSQWREPIKREFGQSAYSAEHFESRAATSEPPLTQTENAARAAILCLVAWGILWEYGHYNQFTGKTEHRPWFVPFLETWWEQNAEHAFAGITN